MCERESERKRESSELEQQTNVYHCNRILIESHEGKQQQQQQQPKWIWIDNRRKPTIFEWENENKRNNNNNNNMFNLYLFCTSQVIVIDLALVIFFSSIHFSRCHRFPRTGCSLVKRFVNYFLFTKLLWNARPFDFPYSNTSSTTTNSSSSCSSNGSGDIFQRK